MGNPGARADHDGRPVPACGGSARPVLVAVLLLAGQVPDSPADPSDGVTAVVAALALATVGLTYQATALPVYVIQTVAPHHFPAFVVRDVDRELEDGSTELVVMRATLLGEMLRQSLRREDSIALWGTLDAIIALQETYLTALDYQPSIRSHQGDDGSVRRGWLAEDLTAGLVAAAEQGLRDYAPGHDVNGISRVLGQVARRFIEEDQFDDARRCVQGLIGLETSAHQVTPGGAINWHGPPAEVLADLERVTEEHPAPAEAAYILAGWALVVAYPVFHFELQPHLLWESCIERFGQSPPWGAAEGLLRSRDWVRMWGNKQYRGARPVVAELKKARRDHAAR
jgi:hypothetical protein